MQIHYFTITVDEQVYKKGFTTDLCRHSGQHIATIDHHHTLRKNDSMNAH